VAGAFRFGYGLDIRNGADTMKCNQALEKDTAAEYVAKKFSLHHISSGDLVRDYITKNNLGGLDRPNVHKYAIELRNKFGGDYLVRVAFEKTKENLIVSGLRAIDEVETFKRLGGIVIAVVAPMERRYEFSKKRGRIGDDVTFEDFKKIEEEENESKDRNGQNVKKAIEMANIVIENDGTLEDLFLKCEKVVRELQKS
jgi:dephospho-CoA kinase